MVVCITRHNECLCIVEVQCHEVELSWMYGLVKEEYVGYWTCMEPIPSSPPRNAYVFIRDPEVNDQGRIHLPGIFWSFDRGGEKKLTTTELEAYLGYFDLSPRRDPFLFVCYVMISWPWWVYESIRHIQKACGFDPESDDLAKYLGVTGRVEIEPSLMKCEAQGAFDCNDMVTSTDPLQTLGLDDSSSSDTGVTEPPNAPEPVDIISLVREASDGASNVLTIIPHLDITYIVYTRSMRRVHFTSGDSFPSTSVLRLSVEEFFVA